jgi:ESS family glutamate:Na+ symporter
MEFLISLCVLCVFLLVGKALRANIKLLQRLFLPSAIIAGFIALAMGPYGLGLIPEWILSHWKPLAGILINLVFATLFLGVEIPGVKKIWASGGSQLCFGVVAGMGQYFIALLVTVLVLVPLFGVHKLFACIVEIGFSGGHGTAAGMKHAFEGYGFTAGGDLSLMSATVGVLSAVIVGMILINIAIRKDYCAYLSEKKGIPSYKKKGLIPEPKRYSIATATVASEAIEPLTFHFAIVGVAVLIGWGMLSGFKALHPEFDKLPLFPLAMIGGLIVQKGSMTLKVNRYFDKNTFDRILGFSLDILVISAIASINLDVFVSYLWPFVIIMVTGISWMVFCAVFLAPRMFPRFWFERGITEFGMQTGVTAIGLLLLRVVDPLYKTDTAKAFGFKQMIYEPFLGGGFITAFAPMLVTRLGMWESIGVAFLIMVIFFLISLLNRWINFKPELQFKGEIP